MKIDRKIGIVSFVCTILGLIGIGQTIWFYVTGTKSPAIAITLDWPSFSLYLNVFVLGIVAGPGMRNRIDRFRMLGLVSSVVWGLGTVFAIVLTLFDLSQYPDPQTAPVMLLLIALELGYLGYCLWQFNVLRGAESVRFFSVVD